MSPHRTMIWIASLFVGIPAALLLGFFALRPQPGQATPALLLEQDRSIDINLTAQQSYLYSFHARSDRPTRIQLETANPDFAFAAEVRDSRGNPVAVLNGGTLDRAVLTIEPGDERYQLSLMSTTESDAGQVRLTLGAPPTPAPTPEPVEPVCGVISAIAEGAPVRSGPRPEYTTLAALQADDLFLARGRIRGGWFLVELEGGMGWVSQDSVQLYGECAQLPLLLDPAIPAAPVDVEPFVLSIDRDGSGQLAEVIAYPYEDTGDIMWLDVLNLYNQPPSNYREFALSLVCDGVGMEYVRWGAPEAPVHTCGETIIVPVMFGAHQQPFIITLPQGSEQSYVRYTLVAHSLTRAA